MNFVMNDHSRDALLSSAQEATRAQRRRLMEVMAREHVGAAGWAQTTALDGILRAGREGLVATDTLRQVVRLTTEQLRALPLMATSDDSEGHRQALHEVVTSGEEQLTAAQALEELVCQALEDVGKVPRNDLNVTRLSGIQARLQEQIAALNTILESARVQAHTLQQVAALERVSAEHQEKVNELQQISNEEELAALGAAGEGIVTRIAQIDSAHPQQLDALQQIGASVIEQMPETGAQAGEQAQALENIAQAAQEKAEELRSKQG